MAHSHSLQLSAMINNEKTLFKEEMNHYLETKLNDLLTIVKTNVTETIDTKLSDFYTKTTSVDYDKVLFDIDGSQILRDCVEWLQEQQARYSNVWSNDVFLTNKHLITKLSSITDNRCFALGRTVTHDKYITCVYKNIIIEKRIHHHHPLDNYYYKIIEHTLSNDVLFAFKHMQLGLVRVFENETRIVDNSIICNVNVDNNVPYQLKPRYDPSIDARMHMYEEHPEYFQQHGNEFERFCQKEYEEIDHLTNEYGEKFANLEADREYFRQHCVKTEDIFKTKYEEIDRMKAEYEKKLKDLEDEKVHYEQWLEDLEEMEIEKGELESGKKEAIQDIHQIIDDLEEQTMLLKKQAKLIASHHNLTHYNIQVDESCKKKKKVKRDPLEPKRPPSAFLLYFNEQIDYLKIVNPRGIINMPEVMKKIGIKWSEELTESERFEYRRKADLLLERYYKDMEEYKATIPDASDSDSEYDGSVEEKEEH